jgi:DNA repair protein RadC
MDAPAQHAIAVIPIHAIDKPGKPGKLSKFFPSGFFRVTYLPLGRQSKLKTWFTHFYSLLPMNATTSTHVAAHVRRASLGAPALVTLYASLLTLPHAIADCSRLPVFCFLSPLFFVQEAGMTTNLRIKDLPDAERPRERLLAHGADALRNAELVAILLRTGMKGASAIQIAEQLLQKFSTLENLAKASLDDIRKIKGIGRDKAIALKSAFTLARRMAQELQRDMPLLDNPNTIADLLREDNRMYEVENFQVILLNTRRRLIRVEQISQGTLDTILVHPREVFKTAIAGGASAIVLAHNHPSGDPSPSEADIKVTRDLIRAGQLLKIEVLDHIILGRATHERPRDFVSLRELGYFYT